MIVYGGRYKNTNILNDVWGLIRHRNGSWEWQRAPISNSSIVPRFQVALVYY